MRAAFKVTIPALLLLPALTIANTSVEKAATPAPDINPAAQPAENLEQQKKIAPAASAGQLLYENHCLKCHESNVHIRKNSKAKSPQDVRTWVNKWQSNEKLGWDAHNINSVADYLIERYYKF